MHRPLADLVLTDADGDPVAVVGVKRRASTEGRREVAELRRLVGVPYGVLFSPEAIEVVSADDGAAERTDAAPLLAPLRKATGTEGYAIGGVGLRMFADLFAEDFAAGRLTPPAGTELAKVAAAAAGGRVLAEVPVGGFIGAAA